MKQVIQSYKTGVIELADVPMPLCKAGGVIVKNVNSLISVGTEKAMIDIAKKSLIGKAKARPDLVKRLIDKAKREGLINVYKEAMSRLDEPVALGYSSSGIVTCVGSGVTEFKKEDRVACVGAGFASHAEFIWVPENLCIKLPDNVNFENASFLMLGGIALQGVRLAEITFGECVVVVGLGLLGLLTVQLLQSYGCEVIGIDIDERKVRLAKEFGAQLGLVPGKDDIQTFIENFTKGHGADAVIITASSKDNTPLVMAEDITRKKGRIVLVGVADIHLTRKTFWEKELSFTVSKAAGPGSIEPVYEQEGYDYPVEYVRWTEKRNLEHIASLLSKKKLHVEELITHRFSIEDAIKAYDAILSGKEHYIGVLLEYGDGNNNGSKSTTILSAAFSRLVASSDTRNISVIGGGMFTKNILLPSLCKVGKIKLKGIATTTGMTSRHIGEKYGFEYCTSDYKEILDDKSTDSLIITTRHHLHAKMVIEGLEAGKHVFVEKPLCINEEELQRIIKTYNSVGANSLKLMVGFNRRYSSLAREAKSLFGDKVTPMVMVYRINAGYIPDGHWTQDKAVGGGRIIGEVCHFVDFLQFMADSIPVSVCGNGLAGNTGKYRTDDNIILNLKFANGSIGTIIYTASGSKAFSRERVEIFAEDSVLVIDDFKTAFVIKNGRQKSIKRMSQDMGYAAELDFFVNSDNSATHNLLPGYMATTLATLKTLEAMEKGSPLNIEMEQRV